MASPAPANQTSPQSAFRVGLDISSVVTHVASIGEARALPRGTVVGDLHGGLTFTDAVAAALESRSRAGWCECESFPDGDHWTIIVLDR